MTYLAVGVALLVYLALAWTMGSLLHLAGGTFYILFTILAFLGLAAAAILIWWFKFRQAQTTLAPGGAQTPSDGDDEIDALIRDAEARLAKGAKLSGPARRIRVGRGRLDQDDDDSALRFGAGVAGRADASGQQRRSDARGEPVVRAADGFCRSRRRAARAARALAPAARAAPSGQPAVCGGLIWLGPARGAGLHRRRDVHAAGCGPKRLLPRRALCKHV